MKITAIKLTPAEWEALRRVYVGGADAWCDGKRRAGGAVSRLFGRMKTKGLVTGPPWNVTRLGIMSMHAARPKWDGK